MKVFVLHEIKSFEDTSLCLLQIERFKWKCSVVFLNNYMYFIFISMKILKDL